MLPCLGGDRWFPLTSQVAFFHAPLEKVVGGIHEFGRRSSWAVAEHPDLSSAVAATAPHPYLRKRSVFAIPTRDGQWCALLASGAPGADVGPYFVVRAQLDVGCDLVAADWAPRSDTVPAGASFTDYRHVRRGLFAGKGSAADRRRTQRTVQVSRQDRGWEFDALGPVRDYEDPAAYERTPKSRRLDLPLLDRYLEAAGIPVHDENWLTGPVRTATARLTDDTGPTWSAIAELRELCGYPATGVPEQL